jgi:hypothetical protein
MPESVAHFLRHALRRRVDEFDLRVKSDWFDYSNPRLIEAQEEWREALYHAAHFPADLWRQTLQQAVRLVASHLLNPEETLARFIFGPRTDPMEVQLVKERLGYFLAYRVLADVVRGYFEKKGLERVSRPDFSRILVRADRTLTSDYTSERWLQVLGPLFEMASLADPEEHTSRLPVGIVRSFFEAKGRNDVSAAIVSHQGGLKSAQISAAELAAILDDVGQPREIDFTTRSSEGARVAEENHAPRRYELHQQEEAGVPLWERFRKPDEDKGTSEQRANGLSEARPDTSSLNAGAVGKRAPHPDDASDVQGQPRRMATITDMPRWRLLQEEQEEEPAEPESDEEHVVEERVLGEVQLPTRNKYIEKLFAGDSSAYHDVLSKLDAVETWDEASQIVAVDVFRKFAVNIYEEPAISFTRAVESRFATLE